MSPSHPWILMQIQGVLAKTRLSQPFTKSASLFGVCPILSDNGHAVFELDLGCSLYKTEIINMNVC